jgi:hypothetical protein
VKLAEGSYTLKVEKSILDDSTVNWKFCGKDGKQGAELQFKVHGESCEAEPVKYSEKDKCGGLELDQLVEAVVTVAGAMELHGLGSGDLSPDDSKLLRHAITEEFSDANLGSSPLPDHATDLIPLTALPPHRKLVGEDQSSVKQVAFKVTMKVSKFELADLKKYIQQSMSSGLFTARVHSLSKQSSASTRLASMSKAALLDLHMIHETRENEKISVLANAVVGVCGMVGLVLAALLVVRYRKASEFKYEMAAVDTEHGLSNECGEN